MRHANRRSKSSLVVAILTATAIASCSFAPPPQESVVVLDMPAEYAAAEAQADSAADTTDAAQDSLRAAQERWWEVFDDPVLNRLVDTALVANLDLAQAVARVEEVRQRYRIARSAQMPQIGISGDATYQSQSINSGFFSAISGGDEPEGGAAAGAESPDRIDYWNYTAALGLSYEIDFWGKLGNDTRAAISEYLATESDFRTARLGVIAATISTYLEVVQLRRDVELTRLSVDLLEDRTELTDQRYYRGLTSSFELYTIRSLYRRTQSSLPVLESRLEEAKGRLAILLGRYAGQIDELLGGLDDAPEVVLDLVPVELPAGLLEQRPDVLAAWQRMEAARYRIGARKAELYPSIRLNVTAGLQAGEISDLFRVDQYFINLIGGLTQPLFQGGRLRAQVGTAEAQFQQFAIGYVRSVLTAYKEVQTSLVALEKTREQYEFLEQQQASARASVDFQLRSFRRGVGGYIEYLDARNNLVAVDSNLASAERLLAEARLAVHRALGGAWVVEQDLQQELKEDFERLGDDLVPVADANRTTGGKEEEAR
jgi:NodT family efflux transporter outer membrane factor (OMF) lipoprotein